MRIRNKRASTDRSGKPAVLTREHLPVFAMRATGFFQLAIPRTGKTVSGMRVFPGQVMFTVIPNGNEPNVIDGRLQLTAVA